MGGEESGPKLTQKISKSPIFVKLRETTPDVVAINEFRFLEEKKFQNFFDHKGPPCVSKADIGLIFKVTHRGDPCGRKNLKFFFRQKT